MLRATDELMHTVHWIRHGPTPTNLKESQALTDYGEYRIVARDNLVIFELLSQSDGGGEPRDLDIRTEETQSLMGTILGQWVHRSAD